MSHEFSVPADRQTALDLLAQKKMLFTTMKSIGNDLEEYRFVEPESPHIIGLISMFNCFGKDIETLREEITTLEVVIEIGEMN